MKLDLFYTRSNNETIKKIFKADLNFKVYKITIQDDESDSEPEKSAQGAAVGTMNKEEDKRVRAYLDVNKNCSE